MLDSSCSMRGEPWQTAVAAVDLALQGMQPGDTFNLVRFSSAASSLFDRPVPATPEHVAAARAWMDRFEGGGTDMSAGLLHSLQMPGDPEALRLMLLLTDGYIGTERALVQQLEGALGQARIFSLGIGSSVNRMLLERVAEIGRGDAIYQLPQTPLSETVQAFHRRIAHPAMTDIELAFDGIEVYDLYPSRVPDAWIGQPLRVVGRYAGAAVDRTPRVSISGLVDGERYRLSLPVDLGAATVHEAIPAIWARRRIHDLTYDFQRDPEARAAEITHVALQHHLVSDHTSLIAEERAPGRCGPASRSIDVEHYTPEGTRGGEARGARTTPPGASGAQGAHLQRAREAEQAREHARVARASEERAHRSAETAEARRRAEEARHAAEAQARAAEAQAAAQGSAGTGEEDRGCEELVALEAKAMLGRLGEQTIACLSDRVAHDPERENQIRASMLLMADAWAGGDHLRWESLARRHLTTLDSSDPNLCYKHALLLSRRGVSEAPEVIRWVEVALENRAVWTGDTRTSRVDALHRLRARASQQLWEAAATAAAADPSAENESSAEALRASTRAHAQAWHAHALRAGKDTEVAQQLCATASTEGAPCDR